MFLLHLLIFLVYHIQVYSAERRLQICQDIVQTQCYIDLINHSILSYPRFPLRVKLITCMYIQYSFKFRLKSSGIALKMFFSLFISCSHCQIWKLAVIVTLGDSKLLGLLFKTSRLKQRKSHLLYSADGSGIFGYRS